MPTSSRGSKTPYTWTTLSTSCTRPKLQFLTRSFFLETVPLYTLTTSQLPVLWPYQLIPLQSPLDSSLHFNSWSNPTILFYITSVNPMDGTLILLPQSLSIRILWITWPFPRDKTRVPIWSNLELKKHNLTMFNLCLRILPNMAVSWIPVQYWNWPFNLPQSIN